jgi:hypothetical protein
MNVKDLRDAMADLPDTTPVMVNYEQFAQRAVDAEHTGLSDGVFWIVAID